MPQQFKIDFLDHVAIRVKNLQVSVDWYREVLGLREYKLEKWGDFPIFMLAGKTGIALFPADTSHPEIDAHTRNVKIDHFAFNVSNANFLKAQKRYETLKIPYNFQDHHYFHSVYTNDPDGHVVELTTLMVQENEFYEDFK